MAPKRGDPWPSPSHVRPVDRAIKSPNPWPDGRSNARRAAVCSPVPAESGRPAAAPPAAAGIVVWEPDPPAAAPSSPGLEDLLSDALGPSPAPTAAAAGAGFGALDAALLGTRRRRMDASDTIVLAVALALVGLGLAWLLVLSPVAKIAGLGGTITAAVLAVLGAGLGAWALRRNLLVALPGATAVCCLVIVGFLIRPLPKTQEEMADEVVRLGREFIEALESIHDEQSLRQARPKVLGSLTELFAIADRAKRLEFGGKEGQPGKDAGGRKGDGRVGISLGGRRPASARHTRGRGAGPGHPANLPGCGEEALDSRPSARDRDGIEAGTVPGTVRARGG